MARVINDGRRDSHGDLFGNLSQPSVIGLSLDKGCAKGAPTAEMRT